MKVGREVRVVAEGEKPIEATGKITAVDSIVDTATRNVQVQATFANPKGTCTPACS